MERTLWTDERIDDAMARIEKRFDDLEARMGSLEAAMHNIMLAMLTGFLSLAGLIVATSL